LAAAPAGRQGRPRPRPSPGHPATDDRHPAPGGGGAGRGRDPQQPAALGARYLDRPRAAPAGHDPRDQPAPQHLRRGRPANRPLPLPGLPQGGQRRLHRVPGAAAGRLPGGAAGGGGLRQRDHPPLQARAAVAGRPSPDAGAARRPLQPHDNPTERIWAALKAWLANHPTQTIQGRIRQVHAFFRARSPAQLLATAAPHSSPWLPEDYGQNHWEAA
jgi:hypothetical protein